MTYIFLDPDGTQDFGLFVIVEAETGVTYANQCAGYLTEPRTLEGFLIPVGGPKDAKVLYDWFWKSFHGNCYRPEENWTPEMVSQLRDLISQIPCWRTVPDNIGKDQRLFLQLDEDRMSECVEAWIPVITPYGKGILDGKGILVFQNSD